ncbi:zinc-dependent metalloprotease [Propioniciclava soli]|uniref:zinc-dependent metalloprotease n=1 Tax=Propioniciclava soli TaxID=2775081 RepID=UPI001E64D627|nr:zinc-dependent metalloprotease [Propioniciclava soli]
MPDRDEPNPMEEFFKQFGLQPGPDGNYDLNQLMGPLQQAMQQFSRQMDAMGSGDGSHGLNWTFVRDIARKVTAAAGPDPSPTPADATAVRDAVGLAELWLDQHTAFGRSTATAAAWSRAEWVEATMATWQELAGGVSASLAEAISGVVQRPEPEFAGMAGFMEPLMRQAAAGMLAAQVGQGIGQLATDVVSVSDLGFPLTEHPVVALLPANVRAFAEGLDQPLDDVRLYLALRETARQRLFANVGWLGPQMLALIGKYARDITIDAAAFEEAIESQLSGGMSPEALQEFGSTVAGRLFQPSLTPDQVETLARLETLVAVVEGWVDDVVAQTTAGLLPRAEALLEVVRRRRASAGAADAALKTLLNLELTPRRVRDAANAWAALRSARGIEERDAVWAHPDLMPTAADLDDPLGFAERGSSPAPAGDDLDAALAALLEQEGGSGSGTSGPTPVD